MKKYKILMVIAIICLLDATLNGMQEQKDHVLKDSGWFYSFNHGNTCCQKQEWSKVMCAYRLFLNSRKFMLKKSPSLKHIIVSTSFLGTEYDRNQVKLNLALCLMAQGQAAADWACVDALLNIADERRIENQYIDNKKSVLVRTDQLDADDVLRFLAAACVLKKSTVWDVIVSVPQALKDILGSAANEYELNIVGAHDISPKIDYETHLLSLLGYFELTPVQLNSVKVVLTSSDKIMNAVKAQIMPLLNKNNVILAVFLGKDIQKTMIGGRKLAHNPKNHGRHLNSEPFNTLLKNNLNLVVIDCGAEINKIIVDDKYQGRCLPISGASQSFDAFIALAHIMNEQKRMVAIGADSEQTHVFVSALTSEAQKGMAYVISNPEEYGWYMEGKGTHMFSCAHVCKSKSSSIEHQTDVIERVYQNMILDF